MPDEPMPDEHAFLRDSAERDPEVAGRTRPERPRRRVALRVFGIAVAAAAIGFGVAHSRTGERPAADVTIRRDVPPTTARLVLQSPVPPPKGTPFPEALGAGTRVLRHSGGPYLSRSRIATMILTQLECTIGKPRRAMPGFACARVDVAFFERYADAWKLRGAIWAFVHAWAADREMYVVTVWGHLESETEPASTEITTVLIDATTGRTMMQGGPPLPAAEANR